MDNTRVVRIYELKRDMMAPYRKDLPADVIVDIANQRPVQKEPLVEYLLEGNRAVSGMVAAHTAEYGVLGHPAKRDGRWTYSIGIKQCTDARHVSFDLDTLMKFMIAHERTAGSLVIKGHVFLLLAENGIGIVETHEKCGALLVARNMKEEDVPPADMDTNIFRLVRYIPPEVTMIHDAERSNMQQARAMIHRAKTTLEITGRRDVTFFPAYMGWNGMLQGYTWIDGVPSYVQHNTQNIWTALSDATMRQLRHAVAERRDFDRQYAAHTVLYDAYRLGRINDPRAIFGLLGNEAFCVTVNLRPFDPKDGDIEKAHLSRIALGSLFYANFDRNNGSHGHVAGVKETHILSIVDTSEDVLCAVKRHLLEELPHGASALVKELTENGKKILLFRYDRNSAKVTHIVD